MPIAIRSDPLRVGYAMLDVDPPPSGELAVSIQFIDKSFLGPDGMRGRERFLFPAEPISGGVYFRLGPAITAHVREAEFIALADATGRPLGSLPWDDIRPPPQSGHGARIGAPPRRAAETPLQPANVRPDEPKLDADEAKPAEDAEKDTSSTLDQSDETPELEDHDKPLVDGETRDDDKDVGRRRRLVITGVAMLLMLLVTSALVLAGRIGWALDTAPLHFSGRQGGPFRPDQQTASLRARWIALPLAALIARPFDSTGSPTWLDLAQEHAESGSWRLRASTANQAAALSPGTYEYQVPVRFPLRGLSASVGVPVSLRVEEPTARPARTAAGGVDDVACDRAAANRFDADRPASRGFADELFDVDPAGLESGIAACDQRTDRSGPDRRFIVQRGRLLAARAVQRAIHGDVVGARQDMDDALRDWGIGAAMGSAYAENLIGAYFQGIYNRPQLEFVHPDDDRATAHWMKGMQGGNVIAERNYAAQLMLGRGTPRDPDRGMSLLRDALAKGDGRAGGVLGIALYTGFPPGVPIDKDQGWGLIKEAQCFDKSSADLLAHEIARGVRPRDDHRSCG